MNALLARIFLLALMIAISVSVMVYGWGLTPRSWWWIIGMGFFGNAVVLLVNRALDKEDE